MITYAEQVRDEDRKIVAENVTFDAMVVTFKDDPGIGKPKDEWCWKPDIQVNENSIINAPKQELI